MVVEGGTAFPPPQVPQGSEAAGSVTEGFSKQTLLTKSVMNSEDSQSCQLFSELLPCSVALKSSPDPRDPSLHSGLGSTHWECSAAAVPYHPFLLCHNPD